MRTLTLVVFAAACTPQTLPTPEPQPVAPITRLEVQLQDSVEISSQAGPIAFGDLDGDGFADAVFPRRGSSVQWVRSDGTGGLESSTLFTEQDLLRSVAADLTPGVDPTADSLTILSLQLADMDGDGRDDIAMRLALLEDGVERRIGGVLYAPASFPIWSTLIADNARASTIVADLDGDGLPEWAHLGLDATVLTSSGGTWPLQETFSEVQYPEAITFDTPEGPLLAVFVNYAFGITEIQTYRPDSDGLTLVTDEQNVFAHDVDGNRGPARASTEALLQVGEELLRFDGTEYTVALTTEAGSFVSVLATGDVTGDGSLDIITHPTVDPSALYASREDGTLEALPFDAPDWQPAWIGIADADADGLGDLWVIEYREDTVVLELWGNVSE